MATKRSKTERRVPAVKQHLPLPARPRGAGVGISVPVYLPVALTPPYTIAVLETNVESVRGNRKRSKRTDNARTLEYDDPEPPYIVKVRLKISKGRS